MEEYDLRLTSRSSMIYVPLTSDERAEDLINLPDCLKVLPPPGLSAEKANECQKKLRRLAPEHAMDYYSGMKRELQELMDKKAAAKNKVRNEAKKIKRAKIAAANA